MQPNSFHILAKPVGPICNLNCQYCFYLEKENLYPNVKKWAMPDDVLEQYIKQYIEGQTTNVISFAWQGGEPTLLGVDYFRKIVDLQKKYANGKIIENGFQTNGVLLDDEWGAFLHENKFLIGLSIDGPAELHNKYRVDKGNHPTFEKVIRGLEMLQKHEVEFNTLTTVHKGNVNHPLEVYEFLKGIGSKYLQFIPIVERRADAPRDDGLSLISPDFEESAFVTEWSVNPRKYGKFLCDIFDQWVCNDIGETYVQMFDLALEMWVGRPSSLCIFRPECGLALAVEHNGDLYSCDHFVYPENKLGNIMEENLAKMVGSEKQQKFGKDKKDKLPKYCQKCDVRFACNGECPKHRFMTTPDGEEGLSYLCPAYKKFFSHVDPYMNFMGQAFQHRQPPASVMPFARAQIKNGGIRPNDPCPCGSGKKFKQCHMDDWNYCLNKE